MTGYGLRVAILFLAILVTPLPAHTQRAKVFRIGVLEPSSLVTPGTPINSFWEAFRQGLHELGYVEGQNIMVEVRAAEAHYDRLSDLAAELVRLKSDVIVVDGTMAVVAAKRVTTTIPIVMAVAANPGSCPALRGRVGISPGTRSFQWTWPENG